MRLFPALAILFVKSTHLPGEFTKKVAAKRGPHFHEIVFGDTGGHQLGIDFKGSYEKHSNRYDLGDPV